MVLKVGDGNQHSYFTDPSPEIRLHRMIIQKICWVFHYQNSLISTTSYCVLIGLSLKPILIFSPLWRKLSLIKLGLRLHSRS
ncbi:hypothetical protein MKW92_011121, partial [Papaver armeniacum]